MGHQQNSTTLYIIDYGLSKTYCDLETGEHILYRKNCKMAGTIRYSSYRTHLGYEQSRRDDLESLGYTIIYLLTGNLPWQGVKGDTKSEKYNKVLEVKKNIKIDKLCYGLPKVISDYMTACKSLEFEQTPDYESLREGFKNYLAENNYDNIPFDWISTELTSRRTSINSLGQFVCYQFMQPRAGQRRYSNYMIHLDFNPFKQEQKTTNNVLELPQRVSSLTPSIFNETNVAMSSYREDNDSNDSNENKVEECKENLGILRDYHR